MTHEPAVSAYRNSTLIATQQRLGQINTSTDFQLTGKQSRAIVLQGLTGESHRSRVCTCLQISGFAARVE
jgi:hypothetical protein